MGKKRISVRQELKLKEKVSRPLSVYWGSTFILTVYWRVMYALETV